MLAASWWVKALAVEASVPFCGLDLPSRSLKQILRTSPQMALEYFSKAPNKK